MSHEINIQNLGMDDLGSQCARETNLYLRHQGHDTKYCFELFRRAFVEESKDAWEIICKQYQAMVTGWVSQHNAFAATREDPEYFVNGAFVKIFGTITADKFTKFSDLGYLLRYLKMCVHSVIMDYRRTADYESLNPLEDALEQPASDPSPEEQAMDRANRQMLWNLLRARLHDEKERVVIHATFVLDLKPQEILDYFRYVFNDIDEIYRVKQNVILRLRRDPEFRKLFGGNA
jgi:hypothetical protein